MSSASETPFSCAQEVCDRIDSTGLSFTRLTVDREPGSPLLADGSRPRLSIRILAHLGAAAQPAPEAIERALGELRLRTIRYYRNERQAQEPASVTILAEPIARCEDGAGARPRAWTQEPPAPGVGYEYTWPTPMPDPQLEGYFLWGSAGAAFKRPFQGDWAAARAVGMLRSTNGRRLERGDWPQQYWFRFPAQAEGCYAPGATLPETHRVSIEELTGGEPGG